MKPYVPDIKDYKPFYIQTDSDETALDTATEWGLVAKTNPIPVLPTVKDPYSNDFKDEDGDDEYTDELYYESFEYSVQFYIKAYDSEDKKAIEIINDQLRSFFEKIRNGEFSIYDSYTGIGYKSARYNDCDRDSIEFLARDDWARMFIDFEFKVLSPTTYVALNNGVLVEKS